MSVEGTAAVIGFIAGYLCIKLARILAFSMISLILAVVGLKHYGWLDEDYSSWRYDYDDISERVQQTSYWNKAIDFIEGSSEWLQRGFMAGFWVGMIV